jgi:hypothetical protein
MISLRDRARAHAGRSVLLVVLLAGSAHAQSSESPAPRAHHVTISAGALWSGSYSIGDTPATLRSGTTGATPPPFTLFATESTIDQAAGFVIRAGFALTPSITIEGGGSFSRPSLSTQISQDAEQAAAAVASEPLQQYVFDAGALWYLPVHLGSRARLFAAGGGGYLRQLHEERTLVETGRVYYAGTGVNIWLRGGHAPTKSFGLRTDVRANWRQDGIEFGGKTRVFPTVTVLVFLGL